MKLDEIDKELEKKEQEQNENPSVVANPHNDDNRNIIKFDPVDENKQEGNDDSLSELEGIDAEDTTGTSEESSLQAKALTEKAIQDIREMDTRIKENQETIKRLEEKLGSISEDMNELLGLYEIVSGQMNPFVGLSNVTKKRLDTLENFDTEVDSLKNRLDKLESLFGKLDISDIEELRPFTSLQDIDQIIEKALEFVIERRHVDDIIDQALEQINNGTMPTVGLGG